MVCKGFSLIHQTCPVVTLSDSCTTGYAFVSSRCVDLFRPAAVCSAPSVVRIAIEYSEKVTSNSHEELRPVLPVRASYRYLFLPALCTVLREKPTTVTKRPAYPLKCSNKKSAEIIFTSLSPPSTYWCTNFKILRAWRSHVSPYHV